MELEIRRVQKTGASTMTVSLPKDWIVSNSIKPGTPVVVKVLPDGTISIDPKMQRDKEEMRKVIMVDDEETKEHLTRKLIGAYLAGYNIIEVRAKSRLDLELKHAVKEISRMVIGPEVIEETSNTIILHDLSDPVELPQQKCVRRMHLIVNSMHKDAIIALREGDEALAKDVIDRDTDVDRLYWMAVKQYNMILKDRKLSEKIGVDIFEGMSLMLVARGIERIGDHAEKIANNALMMAKASGTLANLDEIVKLSARAVGRGAAPGGARSHQDLRRDREPGRRRQLHARRLRVLALPGRHREGGASRHLGRHDQPQPGHGARRQHAGRRQAACGL